MIPQTVATTRYNDHAVSASTAYTYEVRAKDAAGNLSDPATASVTTPDPPPATVVFSDGFESGNLSLWNTVRGLTVTSAATRVHQGSWAAFASTTGTTVAYAYKNLSPTRSNLYVRFYFKLLRRASTSTVTLARIRTGGDVRLLSLNISSQGVLSYRNDVTGVTRVGTPSVSLNAWHELQVHIVVNGTAGQIETWYDGVKRTELSRTENFGTTAVGRLQLGDETTGRSFEVALDDFVSSLEFVAP